MTENNQQILICRTCLSRIDHQTHPISIQSYVRNPRYENLLVKDMLEKCIPEMDLEISDHTIICNECYDLLISTYTFKCKCFDTEERIYAYIEKNNLKVGDKLDLNCLAKQGTCNVKNDCGQSKEVVTTIESSDSDDLNVIDSDSDKESDKNSSRVKNVEKPYQKREYSCDKCEYKGYRRDLLKRHLRYKCKNRVKSNLYTCDVCSYSTVRKRHLTRHKFTHGGRRPFVCGICDKGFTEKNHIKDHMYKHSGYKLPYKCGEGECKAAYARKCDLNAHILTHVKYRPFMCKLCSKAFLDQTQWNTHMEDVHGIFFE